MKKRTISAPTPDTLVMLGRRMPGELRPRPDLIRIDAIGLLILSVPDLYFYTDVASKSANVVVSEILDSRPQHITTSAIFGEAVAVHEIMRTIEGDDNQL